MPVEVAATRGERFAKDGSPSPDYREERTTIILGKGEARDAVIACRFEPDRIVVDPDAKVLQLRRRSAVAVLRIAVDEGGPVRRSVVTKFMQTWSCQARGRRAW